MAAKIVENWFNTVVWMIPKLGKFPRDQRFLLADRIQSLMCDVLEDLLYSSYSKRYDAIKKLKGTNLKLEKLRYYLRLSNGLKYINLRTYHYISNRINEVGKMIGGWIKYKDNNRKGVVSKAGGKQ